MTFFERGMWTWACTTCGATEADYKDEIQAKVIRDEHVRVHSLPDLCGMSTFQPDSSQPSCAMVLEFPALKEAS